MKRHFIWSYECFHHLNINETLNTNSFIHPSINTPTHPPTHPSIHPSIHQSQRNKKTSSLVSKVTTFIALCNSSGEWDTLSRDLIALGFNNTSTLVGHFVSSPREREKRDRRDSRGDEREGHGRNIEENEWKWRNRRNKNIPPLPLPAARVAGLAQSVGHPGDARYTTPLPYPTTPYFQGS